MVSPPFNGAIMLRGIFHACWIQASRLFDGSFPEMRALKAPN